MTAKNKKKDFLSFANKNAPLNKKDLQKNEEKKKPKISLDLHQKKALQVMTDAGVQLGHRTAHPGMIPQISGRRLDRQILDLKISFQMLFYAKAIIDLVQNKGGTILFVCTRPGLSQIIGPMVPKNNRIIFVGHKQIGGTLTNWESIMKQTVDIKIHHKIQSLKKSKLQRFSNLFTPFLRLLNQKSQWNHQIPHPSEIPAPSLVVLFHGSDQQIPIREAKRMKKPVIAILDSDANPKDVSQPVPGNDDNFRAQQLYGRTFFHGIPSLPTLKDRPSKDLSSNHFLGTSVLFFLSHRFLGITQRRLYKARPKALTQGLLFYSTQKFKGLFSLV